MDDWWLNVADSKEDMAPNRDEACYRHINGALNAYATAELTGELTASWLMEFIYGLNLARFDDVRRRMRKRELLENGVPEKVADRIVGDEMDISTWTEDRVKEWLEQDLE
jgi:hypothetical protein